MVKKLYSIAFALMTFAATANADDNLTFNWAHSIDGATTAGDNPISVVRASDGSLYAATEFGTTTENRYVKLDGEDIIDVYDEKIQGSPYTGTSYNANLMIQKVNSESGSVEWFAYTDKGYIASSYTPIAATSDGGVVVAIKTRPFSQEAGYDKILEIVDGDANTTSYTNDDVKVGEYIYMIIKFNKSGKIMWSRDVDGLCVDAGEKLKETETSTLTAATKDNAYIYGMALDADDNIYVCGNFRTELYFKKSDGTVATLTAKNNTGWTGDSQKTVGDLFLVKLDKNGYYTSSLVADGTASLAYFDNIVYNDGNLYLNGRVMCDSTAMTIGGKEVNASQTMQTEIIASVKAEDLSVNYINVLTSVANAKGSMTIQNKNAQYVNGNLYFTGLINGGFANAGEETAFLDNTKSGMFKGYVIKVDPVTGSVEKSYVNLDGGIGGYFGVYVGDYSTYAFGYDMKSGVILTRLDNTSFGKDEETTLCKYGTVSMMGKPAIDGSNFIMMNRGKDTATFYGTETSYTTSAWGTVYYSYKISDTPTGISEIKTNANGSYDVYTVDGIRIKSASTYEKATDGLAKGLYIINGSKVAVK